MEIYLDDCSDDDFLARLLTQAGHTVHTPRGEGTRAASDPTHLEFAAARGYTLLTHNPSDFCDLHDEWQAQGRVHGGILHVRDNAQHQATIKEHNDQVHHIPLHRQFIPWATRGNLEVVHRADNFLEWSWIKINK